MTKQEMINKLNETDDYAALGFSSAADDGSNELITRKCGRGIIQLNRWYDEEGNFEYSDDVDGWNQQ